MICEAVLGVEAAAQHDGRAEQHRQRRCAKPQVWNSGAAMCVVQPSRSGIRDSSATAASSRPRRAARPWACRSCRTSGSRSARAGPGGRRSVVGARLRSGPRGCRPRSRRRRSRPGSGRSTSALVEQPGELLVVDNHGRLLAVEHLDQLRAGERGVEVEQVGAELGRRRSSRRRSRGGCGTSPRRRRPRRRPARQGAGQRVAAAVELAEGERAAARRSGRPGRESADRQRR